MNLAVELPRGLLQGRGADGVGVLETLPGESPLGVFMVEEIDENAVRQVTPRVGRGCLEVLAGRPGQRLGHFRRRRGRDPGVAALGPQVVGQGHPVAFLHRPDLVAAIGVEGDEGQLLPRAPEAHLLVVVLHLDRAPLVIRRQEDDEAADHAVLLLGVLMGEEELARLVDQHVVQRRGQTALLGKPEAAAHALQLRQEGLLPSALVDPDAAAGDLPGVADPGVQEGPLFEAVAGRAGDAAQPARPGAGDREGHAPDAPHFEAESVRLGRGVRGEGAGRRDLRQEIGQFGQFTAHCCLPCEEGGRGGAFGHGSPESRPDRDPGKGPEVSPRVSAPPPLPRGGRLLGLTRRYRGRFFLPGHRDRGGSGKVPVTAATTGESSSEFRMTE